ncbi:hypothetical protein BST81_18880 [Leptolyngbya sp. 'hensonii']|uniref:hypothetical protein n=1 Tax=Leptolyngbya sp. 'hensonii' TaxID=1922337 RepID=UPI00094F6990|nr:hypothetical protein [Leptolyngbya sp. 'hensonii']OLP16763.1 hypothetical protein BST81_18880 [Leptolyngbya sp. 'hensonii']
MIDENWSAEAWIEDQIDQLAGAIARNHRALVHLNSADRVIQTADLLMAKLAAAQAGRLQSQTAVAKKIEQLAIETEARWHQDSPG